jgi:hypothetical protein
MRRRVGWMVGANVRAGALSTKHAPKEERPARGGLSLFAPYLRSSQAGRWRCRRCVGPRHCEARQSWSCRRAVRGTKKASGTRRHSTTVQDAGHHNFPVEETGRRGRGSWPELPAPRRDVAMSSREPVRAFAYARESAHAKIEQASVVGGRDECCRLCFFLLSSPRADPIRSDPTTPRLPTPHTGDGHHAAPRVPGRRGPAGGRV